MGAMLDFLSDLSPAKIYSPPPVVYSGGGAEQGSEAWKLGRIGKVTGSVCKELMSCTPASSKKSWDQADKICDFGDGFKNIVLHMAYTMHFQKHFEMSQIKNFKYGHLVEAYAKIVFAERYPYFTLHECELIDILPGVFAVSPDGRILNNKTGKVAAFECKANMATSSLYKRTEVDFNDKHPDFWQMQAEMIALKTDVIIYANPIPATDIEMILNGSNPSDYIMDIYFDKHEKSETHCTALLERARIAGLARDIYCSNFRKIKIDDCIRNALSI